MNHRLRSNPRDDRERFEEIKTKFDLIRKELYDIHEEWKKLHNEPLDEQHRIKHDDLIDREAALYQEVRELLLAADDLIARTLERSR